MRCFLGVDSNCGDRLTNIYFALKMIQENKQISVVAMSSILKTHALSFFPQNYYYDCVVEIATDMPVQELLTVFKSIEKTLGRKELPLSWAPRIIDIDILLYGDKIVEELNLVIPHAKMHERDFMLRPMCELAPDFVHPKLGKTMGELLNRCKR